jgi:hypothetical protein
MASVLDFLNNKPDSTQKQEVGIGGFTTWVRVRDSYKLESEAPTSPVEDGSFVNDHIIRKPMTLTIEGSVADVHLRRTPPAPQLTRALAEVGNVTSQYAPARTQSQLSVIAAQANELTDAARAVDNLVDTGEQLLDLFGNKDGESKSIQEQFIDAMEAIYYASTVIDIDMQFRRHTNMVVLSFVASTDNQTDETTFTIEAQRLEFSELETVNISKPAAGTGGQLDAPVDKGTQSGTETESSLIFQIFE